MEYLQFISTNAGVFAVRRRPQAELRYYTQVWRRADGAWQKCHYFKGENEADFSPGLLEAMYQHMDKEALPWEDWW